VRETACHVLRGSEVVAEARCHHRESRFMKARDCCKVTVGEVCASFERQGGWRARITEGVAQEMVDGHGARAATIRPLFVP
jgi:hypothetical protein